MRHAIVSANGPGVWLRKLVKSHPDKVINLVRTATRIYNELKRKDVSGIKQLKELNWTTSLGWMRYAADYTP